MDPVFALYNKEVPEALKGEKLEVKEQKPKKEPAKE